MAEPTREEFAEVQRQRDAMAAEARKMFHEHGQSWNSISGRRILRAAGVEPPVLPPVYAEDTIEDDEEDD